MRLKTMGIVSSLALATGMAAPAYAQDDAGAAAADSGRNVEIVVTAEFRETNVQDTPLAITAVSSEMLEARGQTNISDVARQAPNVTLAAQNQEYGSGMIAYIRGIGQNDPNFALEPGVGIYIDDVYLPTLTGSLLDLMDVDRIEVLRGPQGTLAGRNSIGGSIKIYSQKPRGDNSGSFEVTYGSYNRLDARGLVDIGLSDTLAMRLSGVSRNEDGYIKRLDYALTHPGSNVKTRAIGDDPVLGTLGGKSTVAGKIALRWEPSPFVEVNLSADYTRERSESGVATLLYANALGGINNDPTRPWETGIDGSAVPYNCMFVPYGVNSCDTQTAYDGRYITYSTFQGPEYHDSQSPYLSTFVPHQDLDNYGVALTIDINLADNLALKSISSWREYTSDWAYDVDGAPHGVNPLNQTQENEQISQELRLSGQLADDLIDFTVGGFYFETDGFYTARVNIPYGGLDFIHGPDPTPSENKALFANVTVNLTPDFHITGGIRQSWDRKDYEYLRRNPDLSAIEGPCNFFLGVPGLAGPTDIGNQPNCLLFGVNGTTATFENSQTDWRIAVDYRFTEEFMMYGQVATGYRAGGFNARPYFPSQATAHTPETITSYEVGFKSDLFDRRLRLNAAGFYFDYNDIVLLSNYCADLEPLGQATPCLRPTNVGSAEVKGIEIEASIFPVDNLTIDGSLSYLDFQYTEIDELAGTGVALDDITPYTPEWQYSFGIQYDVPDVMGGDLSFRFDGIYQSEIYTEAGNVDARIIPSDVMTTNDPTSPYVDLSQNGGGGPIQDLVVTNRIEGYFLANAKVGWKSLDDDWGVSLEVQNLFDKYYITTIANDAAGVGHVYGSPGKPRTWAVTVKKSF